MPQNTITALVQTRDGYLWLGTFGGLARFDGATFVVFDVSNTPELKSGRILALAEDAAGVLWIGTEHGGLVSYTNRRFRVWTTNEGLPGNEVFALAPARDGGVWVGTNGGLARFRDERWQPVPINERLLQKAVYALCEDRQGNLWIGTRLGLMRLAQGVFSTFPLAPGPVHAWVHAIREDRAGNLWVGASSTVAGLLRFDKGQLIAYRLADGTPVAHVETIIEDRAGGLWIGTWRQGLLRLQEERLTRFTTADGLSTNYIKSLLQDSEGNLWIGTNPGGLNRWRLRRVTSYTSEEGLAFNGVIPIFRDSRGTIWVGSSCGGLNRFEQCRFSYYTTRDGLASDCVSTIAEDRAGTLWIGGTGLSSWRDGKFTNYPQARNVDALSLDRDGTLWLGTRFGLLRYHDGAFTSYTEANGLVHPSVRVIKQDRQGALWLGTVGGLSRFSEGRFTNYTTGDGLPNNYVCAIHEDSDGVLWLGTNGGGLCRFKEGRCRTITAKDGLGDNTIWWILADAEDNFWLSGNRGVFRVRRQELNEFAEGRRASFTSVAYGVADGMKSSETTGGGQPAGWRMPDGTLWFPTIAGVAVIDPRQRNEAPPPVFIETVLVDRALRPLAEPLTVEPGQRDLEIHYTGLSLGMPEKVQFRYRLAGYESDWVQAGSRRAGYYSSLPPGEYTFQVCAANEDGVWNQQGASLRIIIAPPFWRRWWFVSLAVLSLAGLIGLVHKRRVAKLEQARAAQEQFSRQLLASQERERQRIAAELHDGLGQSLLIIQNRAYLALGGLANAELAREQLEEISASAAHALEETREIAYNLRPYQLERFGLTKTLQGICREAQRSAGLEFVTELAPLDGLLSKEGEISLYRIVQECVNNIIKHAQATQAKLVITRQARALRVCIEDNGCGFTNTASAAAEPRAGGFGLLGIAERVRMLGGVYTLDSAPGRGTTINLILKLPEAPRAD